MEWTIKNRLTRLLITKFEIGVNLYEAKNRVVLYE